MTPVSVNMGAHGTHRPPPSEPGGENLQRIFERGTTVILERISGVFEQAVGYFLFAAFQQFYYDGNKPTGRYMMNGHLMSHGIDAISVPAARKQEFNTEMIDFYWHRRTEPGCSGSSPPAGRMPSDRVRAVDHCRSR